MLSIRSVQAYVSPTPTVYSSRRETPVPLETREKAPHQFPGRARTILVFPSLCPQAGHACKVCRKRIRRRKYRKSSSSLLALEFPPTSIHSDTLCHSAFRGAPGQFQEYAGTLASRGSASEN